MTEIETNKDNIRIETIIEKPEFIPLIVEKIWAEWSDDFIHHTSLINPTLITNYLKSIKNENNGNIPALFVLYDSINNALIGFCWIDNEDANVMNWVKPWLSHVFVMEEYRNKGYATTLLQKVTPLYSPLHLWATTKELSEFYTRFGFELLDMILHYNDDAYIYVMKKM
jgi:GNAT superfamily N-acetyltransferase